MRSATSGDYSPSPPAGRSAVVPLSMDSAAPITASTPPGAPRSCQLVVFLSFDARLQSGAPRVSIPLTFA